MIRSKKRNYMRSSNNRAFKRFAAIAVALLLSAGSFAAFASGSGSAGEVSFALATVSADIAQDPNRPELRIPEIVRLAGPSIVGITVESTVAYRNPFGGFGFDTDPFGRNPFGGNRRGEQEYRRSGAGSGIIISADGYVLTNSHVVDGAEEMKVILFDGTEYDAVMIGQDPANDVAVIKVEATDLIPALIGDSSLLEVGELAVAIGNPLGNANGSVTAGIISALERTIPIEGKPMNLLQTDAAVNPGNSGGALLNAYGEVIAIVTAKASSFSVEGIGYAIPINNVKDLVTDIVTTGGANLRAAAATGPMLGISIRDVDAELSEEYNVPEGVYVVDIEPFSAAERAGVHRQDTIVSLDGQEIKTGEDLNRIKLEVELGVPLPLVVLRHGQLVTLSIVLVDDSQPNL